MSGVEVTPAPSADPTPTPVPVAPTQGTTVVLAPQTPWYLNPVVWTTYLVHAIAIFFLLSPMIVSYPGVPAGVISAIGAITIVLNQLGYQSHSATVRAAELAAPETVKLIPG